MEFEEKIKYEKISLKHLDGLVNQHLQISTEENFLPLFGKKAIKAFYKWWVLKEDVISFVAVENGKVIGHVLGPLNLNYRGDLNKYIFPYILIGMFGAIFIKPLRFIKLFYKRFGLVVNSLKSLFYSKKRNKNVNAISNSAILLSISVIPEYQGKGVAKKLNDLFLEEAKSKGKKFVTLSVRKNNLRAVNFYKKNGWKVLKEKKDSFYFYMNL